MGIESTFSQPKASASSDQARVSPRECFLATKRSPKKRKHRTVDLQSLVAQHVCYATKKWLSKRLQKSEIKQDTAKVKVRRRQRWQSVAEGHAVYLLAVVLVVGARYLGLGKRRRPAPRVRFARVFLYPLVVVVKVRVGKRTRFADGAVLDVVVVRPFVVVPQQLHAVVRVLLPVAKKSDVPRVGFRVQFVLLPIAVLFVHPHKLPLHIRNVPQGTPPNLPNNLPPAKVRRIPCKTPK